MLDGFKQLFALTYVGASSFAIATSMLIIPSSEATNTGKQLFIPLMATMAGNDGLAVVVGLDSTYDNPAFQALTVVTPSADQDCRFPSDAGSALVSYGANRDPAVLMLSAAQCDSRIVYLADRREGESPVFGDAKSQFLGDDGLHAHPVYDVVTRNAYAADFMSAPTCAPQRVCCTSMANGGSCTAWTRAGDNCVDVPSTGTYMAGGESYSGHWSFFGLALYGSDLYLSASGALNDDSPLARFGYSSALFVFNTATAALTAAHAFPGDLINSAPLVVGGGGGTGVVRVYVTTALGKLMAFGPGAAVKAGPVWSAAELPAIPLAGLPLSTFSYLAVTYSGTLLVTTTTGGAKWQVQKSFVAIVNGVQAPPSGAAPAKAGLAPGAAAAVALAVLAAAGGVAYWRVPSVAAAVDDAVARVRAAAEGGGGGKAAGAATAPAMRAGGYGAIGSAI